MQPGKLLYNFPGTDGDISVYVHQGQGCQALIGAGSQVGFDLLQAAEGSLTGTTCNWQCAEHQQQYPNSIRTSTEQQGRDLLRAAGLGMVK